jgi:hypothetical protein
MDPFPCGQESQPESDRVTLLITEEEVADVILEKNWVELEVVSTHVSALLLSVLCNTTEIHTYWSHCWDVPKRAPGQRHRKKT